MTLQSGAPMRSALSRGMITASLLGFAVLMILRPRAQKEGAGARSVSKKQRETCDFSNVAANAEALTSLMELRDYLMSPEKYARYGARMPRGVLLYGPPGTGKTLLARALAGEAGVPFFALAGSDFVEKYVGVGASRVRALFNKARKAGRCVIFIDEIDAMGKRRDEGSTDERDQTLNALLSEMSGFNSDEGVVVIAATNRVEALDPALLRPGRFDRQIEVGLPGRDARLDILKLHSRGKPMADNMDLEGLAALTVGFSGAGLENMLNEAAILAARRGDGPIGMADAQRAFCKTLAGEDRPSAADARERESIAVHEAGHALVSRLLMPENRLARVSILPAGHGAAGYNLTIPAERVMVSRRDMEAQIQILLAGRAAEEAAFGAEALTAGASSDIARATELASAMVLELGLCGSPAISERVLGRQCGVNSDAGERCRALLDRLYADARECVRTHMEALKALKNVLLEREAIGGPEAEALLDAALSNDRQNVAFSDEGDDRQAGE